MNPEPSTPDYTPTTKTTTTSRPQTKTTKTTTTKTSTPTTTLKPLKSRIDDAAELTLEELMATKPALKYVNPNLKDERLTGEDQIEIDSKRETSVEEDGKPVLPGFFQDIVDVLGVLRFGSETFVDYIQEIDFGNQLKEGE